MIIFHSISTKAGIKSVSMQRNEPSVLVSAYFLYKRPFLRHLMPSLSRHTNNMMLDSGSISAIRAGDTEWFNMSDYIFYLARNYPFNIVANLDIPFIRSGKKRIPLNRDEILKLNIENALKLLNSRLPARKLIVLQGEKKDDYIIMLEELKRHRSFTDDHTIILGIGSLIGRRWGETIEIIREVRELLPCARWVHTFGVGSGRRIPDLVGLKVTSTDTAYASIISNYGKVILPYGSIKLPKERNYYQGTLMPLNMATITQITPLSCD
ncbi:MAG: hypothetical protein DRH51_05030 [Candidatus Coatesbacteria bacterium]|nr:MAG: hypothetical protein DRH51_05030 [Candidatus Coatesbacteria bacterium]